jgi:hypothetical protein
LKERKLLKNFAARIGGRFTPSCDTKATSTQAYSHAQASPDSTATADSTAMNVADRLVEAMS